MISLIALTKPGCLNAFALQAPPPAFDSLTFQSCKEQTRKRLLENQHHQCAFYEAPLLNDGDVTQLDHLEPQGDHGDNPARRFDVTNLVACCQNNATCGHSRGQKRIPVEIGPYQAENLHKVFQCSSNGELSSQPLSQAVQDFAFNVLNLNNTALKSQRSNVITKLQQYTIALGTNARRRLRHLSTEDTGFISLHYQELGCFGFPEP